MSEVRGGGNLGALFASCASPPDAAEVASVVSSSACDREAEEGGEGEGEGEEQHQEEAAGAQRFVPAGPVGIGSDTAREEVS